MAMSALLIRSLIRRSAGVVDVDGANTVFAYSRMSAKSLLLEDMYVSRKEKRCEWGG